MEINGDSVRVARVFRGLTQRELAEQVATSEATVWQVERGRTPKDSLLAALSLVLGFDREFFFQKLEDEFTEADCNFRRSTAAERLRKRVLAHGTLFGIVVRHLQGMLSLPKYKVPEFQVVTPADIEVAAEKCRVELGLGERTPILHMGRVLEHSGVMLTCLDQGSERLDAFSRLGRGTGVSVVVLNSAKGSSSRTRYDMAHELGHLVMHGRTRASYADREKQADRFASAFLLPRHGFAREFWSGGKINWSNMFALKSRWKVSIQAMIYRAYDLDLIDAVEFRKAYKAISARGWRKGEPHEPEQERPELFNKAMSTLWERRKIGASEVAAQLHWSADTFSDVTGLRDEGGSQPVDGVLSILAMREKKRSRSGTAVGSAG